VLTYLNLSPTINQSINQSINQTPYVASESKARDDRKLPLQFRL